MLSIISAGSYAQQAMKTSGKVTDTEGEPIPGVTVLIKNTNKGTITDHEGIYEIMVSGPSDTLNFSFIGFREYEAEVGEKSVMNVTMYADAEELSEVIISTQARGQRAAINQQFAC